VITKGFDPFHDSSQFVLLCMLGKKNLHGSHELGHETGCSSHQDKPNLESKARVGRIEENRKGERKRKRGFLVPLDRRWV
jgi:hypothetical protein